MQELMHPELAQRTTLRLGGTALAELTVEHLDDLEAVQPTALALGGRVAVLGRGSNILARGGKLPLVLVRSGFKEEIEVMAEFNGEARVRVSSGMMLPGLLARLAARGYSGLEGLAGIPGTVGGALAMNAGSFGANFGERLESVRLYTPASGLVHVPAAKIQLGYRHFSVPGLTHTEPEDWFLAVDCFLRLTISERAACRDALAATYAKKKSSQPLLAASAGCVFKNPPDDSAGRLLDAAGMKGFSVGDMHFSTQHANFMINGRPGHAKAEDALELMDRGFHAVKERFGIELEREIAVW